MQHSNLCTPGDSALTCIVSPCATIFSCIGSAGHPGASSVSGPFKNPSDPPPKFPTSVNVCSSPPLLVTRTICPTRTLMYEGSNRQAGCPTKTFPLSINGENSMPKNSPKVVSPERGKAIHKPAGNVFGSQLSINAILGS